MCSFVACDCQQLVYVDAQSTTTCMQCLVCESRLRSQDVRGPLEVCFMNYRSIVDGAVATTQ